MALTDHVIVLSALHPQVMFAPNTITFEEVLTKLGFEPDRIAAIPPGARQQPVGIEGEAKVSHAALDFHGKIVTETEHVCGCGTKLHIHHDFVLGAWAQHAAQVEGIDPDHLMQHAVQEIDGRWSPDGKPRVYCLCGERWESTEYMPGPALQEWEAHVRAL